MADNLTAEQMSTHEKCRCNSKTVAMCTIRREIHSKSIVRDDLQLAFYKSNKKKSCWPQEIFARAILCGKRKAKWRSQCMQLDIISHQMQQQ